MASNRNTWPSAVENETGRTTDPVRMYMREMGTVDLLTREGEIKLLNVLRRACGICLWPALNIHEP